jgi:hypothetical protein
MPRGKSVSKRRRLRKALTIAGVSLSVAGAASASAAMPAPSAATHVLLEEEVSDVTLATFYYFDKENDLPSRGAGAGMAGARSCGCQKCGMTGKTCRCYACSHPCRVGGTVQ